MSDGEIYRQLLGAAEQILSNNINRYGSDFARLFMREYHPNSNGGQNARQLFDIVAREVQRLNGNQQIRDNNQLFDIVGRFVEETYQRAVAAQRNQSFGNNGFGGGFNNGGFGGGFGGGGFGNNQGNFGQSERQIGPGSHLKETGSTSSPQPQQTRAPLPEFPAPQMETMSMTNFAPNPFDDYTPQDNTTLNKVDDKSVWGDERARDRRIVVGHHDHLRSSDRKISIARYGAFHQLIMNNPMDVVKDFFDVAPASTIGNPYIFKITYNHLEIIDVPTKDFNEIRNKCIESIKQNRQLPLHKAIKEVLDGMQIGPWKAMTAYLIGHINRALHLAARLSDKPGIYIKIAEFDDLDELLSPTFQHPMTTIADGRHQLESIVGTALWNAIIRNASPMFVNGNIPTSAMQSSPAFPFSMAGVYPNKFAIPTDNSPLKDNFVSNLETYELTKRTYVLQRRSIVLTNILAGRVLSKIKNTPSVITDFAAAALKANELDFANFQVAKSDLNAVTEPFLSELNTTEQLQAYYDDNDHNEAAEVEKYEHTDPTILPVDQIFFATQYGTSPSKYLMGFDVFTTLDENELNARDIIMALKDVPVLTITA